MSLDHGGHLTHGSPVNFSGLLYHIVSYGVDPETEVIDYDEVERIAKECRPKVVVAGASAYPRFIDFERMAEIAHSVGAYLMVDMAHIAGLVAAGLHPSPVPHADIVTSTSHKTLRGPRGGFILTNSDELGAKINKAIFPGAQGGPLMHVIAGKAVAFGEALRPAYRTYMEQVVENCCTLGQGMIDGGLRLVSGGTDNHLCLVDLTAAGERGAHGEQELHSQRAALALRDERYPRGKRRGHHPRIYRRGLLRGGSAHRHHGVQRRRRGQARRCAPPRERPAGRPPAVSGTGVLDIDISY